MSDWEWDGIPVPTKCWTRTGKRQNRSTFAVYESLSALFQAVRFCKLDKKEIENIFYNNVAALFNF